MSESDQDTLPTKGSAVAALRPRGWRAAQSAAIVLGQPTSDGPGFAESEMTTGRAEPMARSVQLDPPEGPQVGGRVGEGRGASHRGSHPPLRVRSAGSHPGARWCDQHETPTREPPPMR